ncbi:MAG: molybdopterin molybdochelatase [Pseudonocardiales bacterium]|nr:molybdopterin molybdochelatase [Pseudonocardiales bacterium]
MRHDEVMRSVDEHKSAVMALVSQRREVSLPLAEAAGLVLTQDVFAAHQLPSFDNSAMDGYAVLAADIAAASEANVVTLPVAEDIPAGRVDGPPLVAGTAHRIMTGAPMPDGADAVVPVEATDAGEHIVGISESRPAGRHVRFAGEDVRVGELVLAAGAVLGAAQLGLLSALGEPSVSVFARPRVLVLSTGSELVEAGRPLRHGQIHESNGIMLATALRDAGAEAIQLHFVPDDVDDFLAALRVHAGRVDLVVTSGGVSAGAYEVVKDALTGKGVEFVKVAMQPGMPQGAGVVDGIPVVTLPGNPVSALVSFEVFLRPAIRAAMGYAVIDRPFVRATLGEAMSSPTGRRQYCRGVLDRATNVVTPIGPPGSHFLRWMAASDCLLDVPADVSRLPAGAIVDVWDLA